MADPTAVRLNPENFDQNSGYGSREGWFVLRVDMATDPYRLVPGPGKQGLDWVLAHELDHVLDYKDDPARTNADGHVWGTGNAHTLHSLMCSGMEG